MFRLLKSKTLFAIDQAGEREKKRYYPIVKMYLWYFIEWCRKGTEWIYEYDTLEFAVDLFVSIQHRQQVTNARTVVYERMYGQVRALKRTLATPKMNKKQLYNSLHNT